MNKYFGMIFVSKIIRYSYTFLLIVLLYFLSSSLAFAVDDNHFYTKIWESAQNDQGLSRLEDILGNNDLNINQANEKGQTALHIAALHGAESIVTYLLKRTGNKRQKLNSSHHNFSSDLTLEIDTHDTEGHTALHLAIINDHLKIAKTLLESGAQISKQDETGATALHLAVQYVKEKEFLKILIDASIEAKNQGPFDIDTPKNNGATALMSALFYQNNIAVKLLIQAGAQISKQNLSGWNALHYAADLIKEEELLKLFIDASIEARRQGLFDIDTPALDGATPLMVAIFYQNNVAVKLLIEAGAQISKQNKEGTNALHLAVQFIKEEELLKLLINSSIEARRQGLFDIDTANQNGITPLRAAIFYQNNVAVKLLIEAGAQISKQDKIGFNALHAAAQYVKEKEFLKILMEAKNQGLFDIDTPNNDGVTALMTAVFTKNTLAIEALLKAHAKVELQNQNGSNILHIAAMTYSEKELAALINLIKEQYPYGSIEILMTQFTNPLRGMLPLHVAVVNGNLSALQHFIKKGIDFWASSTDGFNILDFAAFYEQLAIIEWLLKDDDSYQRLMFDLDMPNRPFLIAARHGISTVLELMLKYLRKNDRKDFIEVKNIHQEDIWTCALKSGDVHTVKIVFQFMKDTLSSSDFNDKILTPSIVDPSVLGGKDLPLCFAAKKGFHPIVNFLKNYIPSSVLNQNTCGIENNSIASASIILNRSPHMTYKPKFLTPIHPIHAAAENNYLNWLPLFANEKSLQLLNTNQKTALDVAYDNWITKVDDWMNPDSDSEEDFNLEYFFEKSNVLIYLTLENLPEFLKNQDLRNKYLNLIHSKLQSDELSGQEPRIFHIKYILELLQKVLEITVSYANDPRSYRIVYEKLVPKIIELFNTKKQSILNHFPAALATEIESFYEQQIGYIFFNGHIFNAFKNLKKDSSKQDYYFIENRVRQNYAQALLEDWLRQIKTEQFEPDATTHIFSDEFEKIVSDAISGSEESMRLFKNALKNKIGKKEVFYYLGILNDYIKTIYLNHKPWKSEMTEAIQNYLTSIQTPRILSLLDYAQWGMTNERVQHNDPAQKLKFGFYASQVSFIEFILNFYKDLKKIIDNNGQLHPFNSIQAKKLVDILPSSNLMKD